MKLNMGCGKDIRKDWVNLDMSSFGKGVVIHDLEKFPYPFKDHSFEYVYCDNVLEHLSNIPKTMQELHRICENKAVIEIIVPYYNSKGASNDVTHVHFFNHESFQPFYTKSHRSNNLINDFELVSLELKPTRFGKCIPFKGLRILASTVFGEVIHTIVIKLRVVK